MLSRRLARLACWLLAVAGVSLPSYSPSVGPLVRALSPMAESEGSPVEEREPNTAESTGIEHLIRCDGRRHVLRPVATTATLLPLPAMAVRCSFFSPHDCPPTEHALRDGLGAPLRI